MGQLAALRHNLGGTWFLLATIVLWGMLVLNLQSGSASIPGIVHPNNLRHFIDGVRALLPIVAALIAIGIILNRFRLKQQDTRIFVSPLGLTGVFGLVGAIAASQSADISLSLYWSGLYLSVPLVLFAVTWKSGSVEFSRLIINLNWLAVILATVVLFMVAIIHMDLAGVIINPAAWTRCEYIGSWFADSGGKLRSTGVGRYAAITAILALGGLWNPRLRYVWAVFLFFSLMLLMATAARTAILGFGGAAFLMIFLYGGKKAAIGTAAVSLVLVPVFWVTDTHNTFADRCILRSGFLPGSSLLTVSGPSPATPDQATLSQSPTPAGVPPTQIPATPIPTPAPSGPEDARPGGQDSGGVGDSSSGTSQTAGGEPTRPPGQSQPKTPVAPTLGPETQTAPASPGPGFKTTKPSPTPDTRTAQPSPTRDVRNEQPPPTPLISPNPQPSPAPTIRATPVAERQESPQPTPPIAESSSEDDPTPAQEIGRVPVGFFTFSGRTLVWEAAWDRIKKSPLIGYGFHADRIMLGTHLHNTYLHSLLQAGVLGSIPFYIGLIFAIVLFIRVARRLNEFSLAHKRLIIQSGGVLMFFAVRSVTESTGAFFGVDWLLLAPIFLFLRAITDLPAQTENP